MPARTCAYCGSPGPLTREHLFPAFLERIDAGKYVYRTSAAPQVVTTKPTRIRDVCARCNNIRLSGLDNFARALCRKHLRRFVRPPEPGYFEYDYHNFCRWLWKLSYNSARTGGGDLAMYRTVIPYILGESATPPFLETVLVGVIQASEATTEELTRGKRYLFPSFCRLGQLKINARLAPYIRFGGLVNIRSYVFYLFGWQPGLNRQRRRRIIERMMQVEPVTLVPEHARSISIPGVLCTVREFLGRGSWPLAVTGHKTGHNARVAG